MGKKGELAAMPSKVLQDGSISVLGELAKKEREDICGLLYRNMEKCFMEYYSANPSEREDFVKTVQNITFCSREVPMES